MNLRPLPRRFYVRDSIELARDLLGRLLVREAGGVRMVGRIVEAEAYRPDDPASHSFRGPTKRNATMFGGPGLAYVYISYGMHNCLNVTAGGGAAVLLRALEPITGLEEMARRRGVADRRLLCAGPGRLCEALGVSLADDGSDLVTRGGMWIAAGSPAESVAVSRRIGITTAVEQPWRFLEADSRFVSRPVSPSSKPRS
ncbi:MAG: DNA-3-methyladenine glycosylase [Actinomycetota bacterium]|nr:DNA-3-methyladenine glycosylase [Actinomycetota bacterium]